MLLKLWCLPTLRPQCYMGDDTNEEKEQSEDTSQPGGTGGGKKGWRVGGARKWSRHRRGERGGVAGRVLRGRKIEWHKYSMIIDKVRLSEGFMICVNSCQLGFGIMDSIHH